MEYSESSVGVSELKVIIETILTHITDDLGIDQVKLESDFCWEIPENQLHLVDRKPEGLTMGSLSDDWEFLLPLLAEREQALSLMPLHVAPLPRYIALKVGQ